MLIRLGITAVILAMLAMGIDMTASARAIAAIDLRYLVLVLGLVAVDRTVMILRWVLLLRASGIAITTRDASRLFLVSSFVGSFLPAGVGADAARAYGLARSPAGFGLQDPGPKPQVPASEALASVAVDRILGVFSIVVMSMVGVLAWAPAREDWRIAAGILAMTMACSGVFWASDWLRWAIPDAYHDHSIPRRVLRLSDAVGRYRGRSGVLAHVMAWSLFVQLLRITQAYFLGMGLGLAVPYSYYLLFMPLGLLMLLLPISVSGFGVPQGVIVWLLRPVGVPDIQSFALSTLIVLTGLAGNLPGLWLWLRQRREIL
ncbi:MAG TPA: lysylphosphatidylglycerol synthase transmembrane domain-containing protein [Vicinamibacterales bacterium]|nr:lysylphosphatidylglycerol synthase transmembrane domain-containing protein [Vicinamibacterales bacterium]